MKNDFSAATAFALAEQSEKNLQKILKEYEAVGNTKYLELANKCADSYDQYAFYGMQKLLTK